MIDEQNVIILSALDVGGSLSEFSKDTNLSFEEIRNNAWFDSRNISKS